MASRQRPRHLQPLHRPGERLPRRTRSIGGEGQRRGVPVQPLPPVGVQALEVLAGQPIALPGGEVGVVDRQLGQLRRQARRQGVVCGAELPDQQALRPTVAGDVVGDEHQRVVLGAEPEQTGPDHQVGGQVKRPGHLRVDEPVDRLALVLPGGELEDRDLDGWIAQEDRRGDAARGLEHGTQRGVTRHQRDQCRPEGVDVERSPQAGGDRGVPGVGPGPQLLHEPQPPLGRGQRHRLAGVAAGDRHPRLAAAALQPLRHQRARLRRELSQSRGELGPGPPRLGHAKASLRSAETI